MAKEHVALEDDICEGWSCSGSRRVVYSSGRRAYGIGTWHSVREDLVVASEEKTVVVLKNPIDKCGKRERGLRSLLWPLDHWFLDHKKL